MGYGPQLLFVESLFPANDHRLRFFELFDVFSLCFFLCVVVVVVVVVVDMKSVVYAKNEV